MRRRSMSDKIEAHRKAVEGGDGDAEVAAANAILKARPRNHEEALAGLEWAVHCECEDVKTEIVEALRALLRALVRD